MKCSINPFFFKTEKNLYCYDDKTRLTIPVSNYEFINMVNEKCYDCNIRNLCNLCFANVQYKNGKFKIPSEYCDNFRKSLQVQMGRYYTIKEKNLNLF